MENDRIRGLEVDVVELVFAVFIAGGDGSIRCEAVADREADIAPLGEAPAMIRGRECLRPEGLIGVARAAAMERAAMHEDDRGPCSGGRFVRDWRGQLMGVDYGGYKSLFQQGVTLACLAHCRRIFFDLHSAGKPTVAEEALRRVGERYAIEQRARDRSVAESLDLRQQEAAPRLHSLREWLVSQHGKTADLLFTVHVPGYPTRDSPPK